MCAGDLLGLETQLTGLFDFDTNGQINQVRRGVQTQKSGNNQEGAICAACHPDALLNFSKGSVAFVKWSVSKSCSCSSCCLQYNMVYVFRQVAGLFKHTFHPDIDEFEYTGYSGR